MNYGRFKGKKNKFGKNTAQWRCYLSFDAVYSYFSYIPIIVLLLCWAQHNLCIPFSWYQFVHISRIFTTVCLKVNVHEKIHNSYEDLKLRQDNINNLYLLKQIVIFNISRNKSKMTLFFHASFFLRLKSLLEIFMFYYGGILMSNK